MGDLRAPGQRGGCVDCRFVSVAKPTRGGFEQGGNAAQFLQRVGFVAETLNTISPQERAQLVEEELVKMPSEERERRLSALFGMLTADDRQALHKKLGWTQ